MMSRSKSVALLVIAISCVSSACDDTPSPGSDAGMFCPLLEVAHGTVMQVTGPTVGTAAPDSVATVTCDSGYFLRQEQTPTCSGLNGNWLGIAPHCLPTTYTDSATNLTWQTQPLETVAFADAGPYCDGLLLEGHNDWRLPTFRDFLSLSSYGHLGFPADEFSTVPSNLEYWTTNTFADASRLVFGYGRWLYRQEAESHAAMCVRGTPRPGPSFSKASNVVTDATTGLNWQAVADTTPYTYAQAMAHCAAVGSGWRLPTIGELGGIVDLAKSSPAFDTSMFTVPSTPSDQLWSSTLDSPNKYATVRVDYGMYYSQDSTGTAIALCVK